MIKPPAPRVPIAPREVAGYVDEEIYSLRERVEQLEAINRQLQTSVQIIMNMLISNAEQA